MQADLAHDLRPVRLHGSGAPVLKREIAREDIQPNDVTADAPGSLEAALRRSPRFGTSAIARYSSGIPMQSGAKYCRTGI